MYRILIVDDEAGHRQGMTALLRMLKPEYLVFEAESGERALQMMGAMSFDMILTDVRMSGMDGLTFLQRARERQPNARCVILSAYGTFEYARRGISAGADEYLLKPVDAEELRACLDRLEGELQAARAAQREQAKMHSSLVSMQSGYVEQQMYRFVMGELPESEAAVVRQIFGVGGQDSGFALYALPENGWRTPNAREDARFLMREALRPFGAAATFSPIPNADALVSVVAGGPVPDEAELAGRLAAVERAVGQRLIAGVCRCEAAFWNRLEPVYYGAREACLRHFFEPDRYLLSAPLEARPDSFRAMRLDLPLREIAAKIRAGDAARAYELFERGLRQAAREAGASPSRIKEVAMYAFIFLLGDADLGVDAAARERVSARLDRSVPESADFPQMLRAVEREIDALCGEVAPRAAQAAGLEEAVAFVRERFCEPLSLAEVARRFHYNPSYFSNQFKIAAGMPFSDFLYELRMRRAAELLLQTNAYAAKIGERVGYPNAAYFTKAFKKKYGLSPDQYRKRGKRT